MPYPCVGETRRPARIPARCAATSRRVRCLAAASLAWAVLAVAWALTPDARGHGTHTQLGLPSCSFRSSTGYPCPHCGLTTAVSAGVHGRLADSWRAHPLGLPLVAALIVLAVAGSVDALGGSSLLSRMGHPGYWLAGGLIGSLAGWAWKLLTGIAAGEYPLH